MNKKKIVIIFISLIIFIFMYNMLCSYNEYKTYYNFIITKIEVTPTKSLVFYDNEEKISLQNYLISKNKKVKIGDILYKEKCAKYLYIYRRDKDGEYKEYLRVHPSGIIPYHWICK